MGKKQGPHWGIFLLIFFMITTSSYSQSYLEEVRACHYLEKGKIKEAVQLLNKKLKRYPKNYDCRLYLGLASYIQGDFEKAFQTLKKIETETERMGRAKSTMEAGKKMSSFSHADASRLQKGAMVFTERRRGLLKFALGMLYQKNKEYSKAKKRFHQALKSDYPELEARKQLLLVNISLDDYKEAQKDLAILKKRGAKGESLSLFESYILYYLGDEEQAKERFSQLSSSFLTAKRNLAAVYYNQQDYQKALELWKKILADSPKDVESLRNSGRAYYHMGQKEKGQEQFDKLGLKIKVEKYSPKEIPLILINPFEECKLHLQCEVGN